MNPRKSTVLAMGAAALIFLLAGSVYAACTGIGQFQGSCTPADFAFSPATTDANMNGYFWARCTAADVAAVRTDSKWNPAAGSGADQGSNTAFSAGWLTFVGSANTGNYRIVGSGWAYLGSFDGCPLETNADCDATRSARSETLFVVTNGGDAATVPAKYVVAAVRYIDSTQYYDIDSISGGSTPPLCVQTCQQTTDGGASWASCGGGASNAGFSVTPSIVSSSGANVTLSWTHPTVRANVTGIAYPISSWSVYKMNSAAAPTNFALASWTEIARVPGSSNTATVPIGAAPANGYYYALLPNFDGDGGLNAGAACTVGVDCPAFSTNTWTIGTAPGIATPKVGPASTSKLLPGASNGTFVSTTASYDSLQKVTIGFTTTDESGVVSFEISRGVGAAPTSWSRIGTLAAKGSPSSYSFADTGLPRQRTYGVYTYRVDAIDSTGKAAFTVSIPVAK
jgi:hypothetical protein